MSPAKIFGIVVRSLGLCLLVYSVWYLLYGIATIAGLQGEAAKYRIEFFISGGFLLFVSIYFLKGAPQLVKFCYPEEKL